MKPGDQGWRRGFRFLVPFGIAMGCGGSFTGRAQPALTPSDLRQLTGQSDLRAAYAFELVGWGARDVGEQSLDFGQVLSSPRWPGGSAGQPVDLGAVGGEFATWADLTNNLHQTANVVGIACGEKHTLLLKRDGTVAAVGSGQSGQAQVPAALTRVVAVAAGTDHSLALQEDGHVVAWGWNNALQARVPTGLSGVRAVAAGRSFSLALLADGTVRAWGGDLDGDGDEDDVPGGQWAPPPELQDPARAHVIAIAAGTRHALALRSNGTVVGWGERLDRAAWTPPPGSGPFVQVRAGMGFSVGLRADGTVRAWGDNRYRQLEVPAGLDRVVALACGSYHALALRSDGTVVGWGNNAAGQVDIPAGTSRVAAIAAGGFHSEVLEQASPVMTEVRVEEGWMGCTLNLAGGERYRLEASSDLRHWDTLEVGTARPATPGCRWRMPSTGSGFYRVRRIAPGEPDYLPPAPPGW